MKAVVDRIQGDGTAVVLAEEQDQEYHLPIKRLPDGVEEGAWLTVEVEDGEVVSVDVDEEEEEERRERVEGKLEGLRERGRRSTEKKE